MPAYAAIDIGSNSIKMLCAEATPTGVSRVLCEDRQVTRIGQSVFADGVISEGTMSLVMEVLVRMRQTYLPFQPAGVRAVATSAVRDSRNQQEFLSRATRALGTEVENISGLEEARLVHLGVLTALPQTPMRALLIDIGGGSAEFILSEAGEVSGAFSKPLGAVRLWQTFLVEDPPTDLQLQRLESYIDERIEEARMLCSGRVIPLAVATSSSALAVGCAVHGIPRAQRASVSGMRVQRSQVERLYGELSRMSLEQRRRVVGIGPRRAEIILPGVALYRRAMEAFGIQELTVLNAGVREGIAVDLARRGVGMERMTLTREQREVVERLAQRFGIALAHAETVARFALQLFTALESLHQLPHWCGRVLEAAGYLLNIGHYVSATRHHKHSHYLVSNVDLPGFTENERRLIALLCRYHRKSMPMPTHPEYTSRTDEERRILGLLIPLLRIADSLDRSRNQRVEAIRCTLSPERITIKLQSTGAADLECWAAMRNADIVRSAYLRTLVVESAPLAAAEESFGLRP